jgi:phosphonate transport system substrate-binding protein
MQRQGLSSLLRTALVVLIVACTAFFSTGLGTVAIAADAPVFKIGFDIRNTQLEDAKQYLPFLSYLSRATGYRFELRFTRKDENIVDLLGTKSVDFAFIGTGSYLAARKKYGVIPLVHGLNSAGKAEYQAAIVVKIGSTLRGVNELHGKGFAFGNKSSTQGHLIPLIILWEHGIKISDLGKYGYTGSHRNCAQAVLKGEYDAGGMQDTLAKEYADEGLLRILYLSHFYPSSGLAVNNKVPHDVAARVKQACIEFRPKDRDAKGLYHWDKTEMANGFVEAKDADYAELRKYALQFGLL